MAVLELIDVTKEFGGLTAVSQIDISLKHGELVGLIGPNGAGKTTVFNLITGVYEPTNGSIRFNGEEIAGLKPYQVTHKGIARTFQNIRLFGDLTVLDNVKIAQSFRAKSNLAASILRLPSTKREEQEIHEKGIELLSIFKLSHRTGELAKNLPYGEQRRLEIARALATAPQLILLDEPAAGMNPQETGELVNLIRWVRDRFDLTVLLIEHDMGLIMNLCQKIYVLDYGTVIANGAPDEIRNNRRVIEAYLGEEAI